ncbi:MAG: HpcH/HpaI aldolase/citrate lyase family protein [Candidatus Methylomirabilia bacterium]
MARTRKSPKPLNPLKSRLQAGKPVFGILITMPSVQLMQVLAHAGFDWLFIDMEHGPIDIASAHAMITATAGTPAVPIVRVPWNLPWLVKPVLDAGAWGIVFPMVRSRTEAETAVRAVRYPPEGERGWGPFYAPLRWGVPAPDYVKAANDQLLTVILIEHFEAVRRAHEIASTRGVDVALIAPFDLAATLGHPGQTDHPEVRAAIAKAEAGILRSKAALGGLALSPEQANDMVRRGYRFLALGYDALLLERAAGAALQGITR